MNGRNVKISIDYLRYVLRIRFQQHFGTDDTPETIEPPQLVSDGSPFYEYVSQHDLSFNEYIILLLALTPHVQPDIFSKTVQEFMPEGGDFPEFGGVKGTNHRGFLPTGETAVFLLARRL